MDKRSPGPEPDVRREKGDKGSVDANQQLMDIKISAAVLDVTMDFLSDVVIVAGEAVRENTEEAGFAAMNQFRAMFGAYNGRVLEERNRVMREFHRGPH